MQKQRKAYTDFVYIMIAITDIVWGSYRMCVVTSLAYPAQLAVLMQATNAGMRRPCYEAMLSLGVFLTFQETTVKISTAACVSLGAGDVNAESKHTL